MNKDYVLSLKAAASKPSLFSALALAAALGAVPTVAQAQSANATVNVSANVNSQCNLQTPTLSMPFGTVDVLAANGGVNAPATLRVQCNKGAQVSITADAGANPAAGGVRQMKNTTNADTLTYAILQPTGTLFDTCPSSIANGTNLLAAAMDVSGLWASNGGPNDIKLCGRLETPQLNASPGAYTDTVTVTVSY